MSTLTDTVEVPAALLDQLHLRLTERRVILEREVLKYGEPPSGIKEVFELCRGFERAYVTFVGESGIAGKVKEAFLGEKGLAGSVRALPFDKVFDLPNVKAVCRYADGYQPHLVSPDKGVHALSMEALDMVAGPVRACVQAVHNLLLNAAREAAEKAGEHTEAALIGTSLPMYVPEFKTVIMPTIASAMEEWKLDAEKMAMMLVDMERSYITAGFFRYIMANRTEKITAHEAGRTQGGGDAGPNAYIHQQQQAADAKADGAGGKSFFPAFGASAGGGADTANDSGDEGTGSKATFGGMSGNPSDFVAAYFEKSSGDSGFTSSISALRWQRRFFIFSDSQKMMYYFKAPEDVPKANGLRGQVNISECLVEDVDDRGQTRLPGSAPPPNTADKANFLLRIRHKDPRQTVFKEHNSVMLRAETYQSKVEWLARLRKATGESKQAERPKPPSQSATSDTTPATPDAASGPSTRGGQGLEGGPARTKTGSDLSWAKDAEPIFDTHLGQGARAFRAEEIRDADGRLPLAPRVLLNPMRMAVGSTPTFEAQYDALLGQIGGDCNVYMRMCCDTICTTVPKAIVHCLIRKSEKNLLEKLFTIIHKLSPEQMTSLLKEEDSVVERRQLARKVYEDVKSAVFQVHEKLERQNLAAPADRADKVLLNVNVFAYAGMPEELTTQQRQYFDKLFSDPAAPEGMRFWATIPVVKPLPGQPPAQAPAQQQQQQQQGGQGQAPPPQQQGPGQGPPPPRPGPPPPPGQRGPPPPPGAYAGGAMPMRVGPPPPGGPGAVMGPIPGAPPPGRGGPPPPVPMRPAAGQAPPPGGVRRAPPPPPGTR